MSKQDDLKGFRDLYFGIIAAEEGSLSDAQFSDALEVQGKMKEMGISEDVAHISTKKGYLDEEEADRILGLLDGRERRDMDFTFGRLTCETGLVKIEELRRCLLIFRAENGKRALSEILGSEGLLPFEKSRELEAENDRLHQEYMAGESSAELLDISGDGDGTPRLGNYEILEELSRGGMGTVYRVRQRSLNRVVALKLLAPELAENTEFIERFHREAKAIAELSHPNIVQVYDYGRIRGKHFIAMEYIDGESLESVLSRKNTLTAFNAAIMAESVARALMDANSKGVIHRDVKPDNLLVTRSGLIKLTDFGLAKMDQDSSDDSKVTRKGSFMGSPSYIAPEQARGEDVDHRVDMYSLGVTLYRVLVGDLPFTAPTSIQVIAQHLNAAIPARENLPRPIPIQAYNLIRWLMAKRPSERPPSWQKVINLSKELKEISQGTECTQCGHPLRESDPSCIQCGQSNKPDSTLEVRVDVAPPRRRRIRSTRRRSASRRMRRASTSAISSGELKKEPDAPKAAPRPPTEMAERKEETQRYDPLQEEEGVGEPPSGKKRKHKGRRSGRARTRRRRR